MSRPSASFGGGCGGGGRRIVAWLTMMFVGWCMPWCLHQASAAPNSNNNNNNNNGSNFIVTREMIEMFILSGSIDRDPSLYTFLQKFFSETVGDDYPIDAATLVRGHDGRCYVRFRGMTGAGSMDALLNGGIADMYQEYEPGTKDVCAPNATNHTTQCCTVRTGMYEAYYATYVQEFEAAVRDCVRNTCGSNATNATHTTDDCLVLAGVSQGAMIAQVAAVALHDLNPITVMYGPHPTLFPNCQVVNPRRMYRMVNTGYCRVLFMDLFLYDFPFFAASRGDIHYGHMLVLSDDPTGIAYMGLNAQDWTIPWIWNVMGITAHAMRSGVEWWSKACYVKGYLQRMEDLIATYDNTTRVPRLSYPIRTTGFLTGNHCTRNEECLSKQCLGYQPTARIPIPGTCQ